MRHSKLSLAACSLFALLPFVITQSGQAQDTKFTGEITDEKLTCVDQTRPYLLLDAKKRPPASEGTTKGACVLYWTHFAKPAEKFVLYDATTKTTYQLDNQALAEQHAGEKVRVTGTSNAASKAIHVTDITSTKVESSGGK